MAQAKLIKIDHMLGYKGSVNKVQKLDIKHNIIDYKEKCKSTIMDNSEK